MLHNTDKPVEALTVPCCGNCLNWKPDDTTVTGVCQVKTPEILPTAVVLDRRPTHWTCGANCPCFKLRHKVYTRKDKLEFAKELLDTVVRAEDARTTAVDIIENLKLAILEET